MTKISDYFKGKLVYIECGEYNCKGYIDGENERGVFARFNSERTFIPFDVIIFIGYQPMYAKMFKEQFIQKVFPPKIRKVRGVSQ